VLWRAILISGLAAFVWMFFSSRQHLRDQERERLGHDECSGGWPPSVALLSDFGYQPIRLQVLDVEAIPAGLSMKVGKTFHIEILPTTSLPGWTDLGA
jgi:hypothetical protein